MKCSGTDQVVHLQLEFTTPKLLVKDLKKSGKGEIKGVKHFHDKTANGQHCER